MALPVRRATAKLEWLVLGGLALLALPILIRPYTGDQSLYLLMADRLRHGAVLYRDVWEIKQPGLPIFFTLTSALAGGSAAGPHIGEFALLLAMAFALQRTVPLRSAWLRACSPSAVIAPYLIDARAGDLTQLELLVSAPLYACLWATSAPEGNRSSRAWVRIATAGLCAGIVGLFKLAYLPMPLLMWVVAEYRRDSELLGRFKRGAQFFGWILLTWLPFLAYAEHYNLWTDLYDTWFVLPRSLSSLGGRPLGRLVTSVGGIATVLAPLLLLAIFGTVRRIRTRSFDVWVTNCFVWLVLAGLAVLTQSWWRYHFYIFVVPVGLLALDGLDAFVGTEPKSPAVNRILPIVIGLFSLLPIVDGSALWRHLVQSEFALRQSARDRFQSREDAYRGTVAAELTPRRAIDAPDGVFYFGNPELQRAAGDRLITAVHGWSPEFYTAPIWERLSNELQRAHPSAVYVDSFSDPLIRKRGEPVQTWLDRSYRLRAQTPDGIWYLREPIPPTRG